MKTRISSEHSITKLATPIAHGVMRFELNKTTLAGVTSVPRVIKLAEVSAGTSVIIEDAWLEVLTAFENGTSFDVGDNQFDNSFLQSVAGDNSGVKQEQSTKGVLLATNSTAVLSDFLTLRVNAPTAIPQQTNNGSAVLHVAFKEVLTDSPFSDILSTSSETPSGMGTVPSSGGGLVVAGTIGQIQYNDGNGGLAAYTPADARTHLELELATGDSAAAGGKILKVNSSGVSSGDLLAIDSNGEIVSGGAHLMPAGNQGDVQTKGSYGLDSIAIATGDSAAAGGKLLKVGSAGVTSGDLLSIDSGGEIVAGNAMIAFSAKGDDTNVNPVTIGNNYSMDFHGGTPYILCEVSTVSGSTEADIKIKDFPTGVTAGSYTNADITVDASGKITAASSGSSGSGGTSQVDIYADNSSTALGVFSGQLGLDGVDGIVTEATQGSPTVKIGLEEQTGLIGTGPGATSGVYYQGVFQVNDRGTVEMASSNLHLAVALNLTTPSSYALSSYQDITQRSNLPTGEKNPFVTHYTVRDSGTVTQGMSPLKYPDPALYDTGVTFTISYAHANSDLTDELSGAFTLPDNNNGGVQYVMPDPHTLLTLIPDSNSFFGNPFICAQQEHSIVSGYNTVYGFPAYNSVCPAFFVSPGGSVTLSVVTAKNENGELKKAWQIIAHYDRYPQYVLHSVALPYSN